MKRYYGAHVPTAGGLHKAVENGTQLEINCIQIFPSAPQRWQRAPLEAGQESAFNSARAESKIEKVFLHAIYLINLATPDQKNYRLSRDALIYSLDLSKRIAAEGVIFHVGSNTDQESEEDGYRQAVDAINWIFENADNEEKLILELSAGSGKVIGARLEELARIYDKVKNQQRLGFALDTQHMWASGYDLANQLDLTVKEVQAVFGLENVLAVHINDSKTGLASRRDRHANLGEGLIGLTSLTDLINHPKLRGIPMMLETPALKDPASAQQEVKRFRDLLL